MDLALTTEQAELRKLAREFVDREIAPHATEWDRAGVIDRAVVRTLGPLGFLGLTIPEECGGSEGDHLAYVR